MSALAARTAHPDHQEHRGPAWTALDGGGDRCLLREQHPLLPARQLDAQPRILNPQDLWDQLQDVFPVRTGDMLKQLYDRFSQYLTSDQVQTLLASSS
jgi:hypothetical protein